MQGRGQQAACSQAIYLFKGITGSIVATHGLIAFNNPPTQNSRSPRLQSKDVQLQSNRTSTLIVNAVASGHEVIASEAESSATVNEAEIAAFGEEQKQHAGIVSDLETILKERDACGVSLSIHLDQRRSLPLPLVLIESFCN